MEKFATHLEHHFSPFFKPHILWRSFVASTVLFFIATTLATHWLLLYLFFFVIIYAGLYLHEDQLRVLRKDEKEKDPATLKIKDKIHFYEKFHESEPTQKLKLMESRKRHNSAGILHEEYMYRGYRLDLTPNTSRQHKRTHSNPGEVDTSTSIIELNNENGSASGGVGENSLQQESIANEFNSPPPLEKSNSLVITKNELNDLAREKKVRSTLVLLKKQHPSFVEERLDWVCKDVLPSARAVYLPSLILSYLLFFLLFSFSSLLFFFLFFILLFCH
jgi:hypothetical protein